jgi:hypothetical protein
MVFVVFFFFFFRFFTSPSLSVCVQGSRTRGPLGMGGCESCTGRPNASGSTGPGGVVINTQAPPPRPMAATSAGGQLSAQLSSDLPAGSHAQVWTNLYMDVSAALHACVDFAREAIHEAKDIDAMEPHSPAPAPAPTSPPAAATAAPVTPITVDGTPAPSAAPGSPTSASTSPPLSPAVGPAGTLTPAAQARLAEVQSRMSDRQMFEVHKITAAIDRAKTKLFYAYHLGVGHLDRSQFRALTREWLAAGKSLIPTLLGEAKAAAGHLMSSYGALVSDVQRAKFEKAMDEAQRKATEVWSAELSLALPGSGSRFRVQLPHYPAWRRALTPSLCCRPLAVCRTLLRSSPTSTRVPTRCSPASTAVETAN